MPPETSPTVTRGHDERYVLPRTYPWSQLRFLLSEATGLFWGGWNGWKWQHPAYKNLSCFTENSLPNLHNFGETSQQHSGVWCDAVIS